MKPLLFGAGAMLLAGAIFFFLIRNPDTPPTDATPPASTASSATRPDTAPELEPRAPSAPPRRAATPAPATPRPAPAEPAPVTATLVLTTDVAGASVFIDRKFVGPTPLTLESLSPGRTRSS